MNVCIFSGYLLEKPELKSSASGKSVCEFRMNVPRDFKSQNGERLSDYISVVAWGRTAEVIAESCDKGTRLNITTHVRTENYTDKNGVKRESHKYEVDRFEFSERKSLQQSQNPAQSVGIDSESIQGLAQQSSGEPVDAPHFEEIGEGDELPF